MSRAYAALGALGAGLCGVLVMYTTFQPELENQRAERLGEFRERHQPGDKVISEAITGDLKEAKQQIMDTSEGGFAWGIRQMVFGKPGAGSSREETNDVAGNNAPKQDNGDK